MKVAGLDWDDGNWPKYGKHGVSRAEIEQVLLGEPAVMADPHPGEPRMWAIGRTEAGRHVFLVFHVQDGQQSDPVTSHQCPLHASEGDRSP